MKELFEQAKRAFSDWQNKTISDLTLTREQNRIISEIEKRLNENNSG